MQLLLIAKYKISIIKMLVVIGTDIEIRVKKIQNSLNSIKETSKGRYKWKYFLFFLGMMLYIDFGGSDM